MILGLLVLIRLGDEKKGIVASGYAATDVFRAPHWEECRAMKGETSKHIYVEFDKMVYIEDSPLVFDELEKISSSYKWSIQSSGVSIPNEIGLEMDRIWK